MMQNRQWFLTRFRTLTHAAKGLVYPRLRMVLVASARIAMRFMASNDSARRRLNARYRLMSLEQRFRFYHWYAKIFRNYRLPVQRGTWYIDFLGRELELPLTPGRMWLDWDLAVSMIGHDIDVVRVYEQEIRSGERPTLFFDVGANYGTHSLLLASQGISVVAFEPNSICLEHAKELASENDLSIRWEHVAVGDSHGNVTLKYAKNDTWLGSLSDEVASDLMRRSDFAIEQVKVIPLDDYYALAAGSKLLIKIDVEGFELSVLNGARRLLEDVRPTLVFEANDKESRPEVYALLKEYGYDMLELDEKGGGDTPLSSAQFQASRQANFMARPIRARQWV